MTEEDDLFLDAMLLLDAAEAIERRAAPRGLPFGLMVVVKALRLKAAEWEKRAGP